MCFIMALFSLSNGSMLVALLCSLLSGKNVLVAKARIPLTHSGTVTGKPQPSRS